MTPETLHAYLLKHGWDEDTVQTVMCAYLTVTIPVRSPKAWGRTVAFHAKQRQEMRDRATHNPELSLAVDRPNPDPLRLAIVRQELLRAIQREAPLQ